jgi:hypothetical protein
MKNCSRRFREIQTNLHNYLQQPHGMGTQACLASRQGFTLVASAESGEYLSPEPPESGAPATSGGRKTPDGAPVGVANGFAVVAKRSACRCGVTPLATY